ncbi:tRNA (adenosine(37)-N6)-threonylcarbamoyltransferase complex transferase subunit TsaD [Dehalogenimonas sp. THU2]|uniref:tRNA (adenosine(37)-N6)-threonylcarbamoyltransferase complex transferase subunit TsaD n=1 Tax=Dehalogenimonas sp. THU2 TaxID=3151121 RepID=UPI0032186281
MLVLGIESSCDETAAAVVRDGVKILSNQIASQVDIHARYGGVVPEVASRQHLLSSVPVLEKCLADASLELDDIDAIAVTSGPGLAGSLLVGVNFAKALAMATGKPLIGVNHLEGHIYANWLAGELPQFPVMALIVSGGHTDLVYMKGHADYQIIGRTRDDAAGEAFDKAARLLNLGYPGGPAVDKAARLGKPGLKLPRAVIRGSHDFSFSGLKTALYRLVETGQVTSPNDAAASFQEAVVKVLVSKTIAAADEYGVNQILLAGGVAANSRLRERMREESPIPVLIPPLPLCTDNAAVIASCGYFHLIRGERSGLDLNVYPSMPFVSTA